MIGRMHECQPWPLRPEAGGRLFAPVRRAVVRRSRRRGAQSDTARWSLPARRAGRQHRWSSSVHSGRTASRDARPTRPGRSAHPSGSIRVRRASADPGRAPGSDASGAALGDSASHRPRSRIHRRRNGSRPRFWHRDPGRGRPSPRTADRGERSSCDAATVAAHRRSTSATSVTPLICATMPRARTSRRSSGIVKRASGTSERLGSSQASRLTSTTTLGGKAGCAPASRLFLKAGQAFFEEAVAPLADDLARRIESGGDEIVAEPVGGEQDDLGADDVSIR